jgi:ABC-2 type transport system ATP-binding protein
MSTPLLDVSNVSFRYGERRALDGVSFSVDEGEIFGLLGPNGGGKTTLFRLLATLLPLQDGAIHLAGADLARQPDDVRRMIGVTFQSPSLDGKLTVRENLAHQGQMYGLRGPLLVERIAACSQAVGVADRLGDRAEMLSGGLKRRVEIAKSLLHAPRVLVLDEPTTGLDPGVRNDLWEFLLGLRRDRNVTILVTTHLMDEAEHCDRLAILDLGKIVALGTPAGLRAEVGGECLTIQTPRPAALASRLRDRFHVEPRVLDDALRIEHPQALDLLRDIAAEFRDDVAALSISKPTLEDVFLARTGRRFVHGNNG